MDVPERTLVDEAASMALALELVAVDSGKNMADLAAAILKFRSRPGWRRIASHLPWFIKKPILKVTGLIS
ncbi:MAG: hypothetical protein O3A63_16785 [Proteobacteria bacterium]|nr:hypothetical protein [Pseudomonadota bacterium]